MPAAKPLVIVGASHAGVQLAATARELGFGEAIVMIGDEPHAPYQRPPLSKGVLTGKVTAERLALRSADFYADNGIDLRLGQRVCSIDPLTRRIQIDNGAALDYGWLALATGARCRQLAIPGAALHGVFDLRTLTDALRLSSALQHVQRACVIGGGFIGLEVAAALRACGASVTVIESQQRLLTRTFTAAMSDYVADAHRRRGVTVITGCGVRALHGGANGRVQALQLSDSRRLDCDLVVQGTGVLPNDELAAQTGMATGNGIVTDALGRTSLPHSLAVGDVANMAWPMIAAAGGPQRLRLESIQAANDGARAAASVLVGRNQPLTQVPWFWSEQFDLKFQMAGLALPGDQTAMRGDMATDRFTLCHLRNGVLVAAHSVNRPAEHMLCRRLIAQGARIAPEQVADLSFDLKCLVVAAAQGLNRPFGQRDSRCDARDGIPQSP